MTARCWPLIVAEGARIVNSYTTSVTLRQLHYRLVAVGVGGYENTTSCYKRLSHLTAEARRNGTFPPLIDPGRAVDRPPSNHSVQEALRDCAERFRFDRTEGQDHQVWVLYEKATLSAQMRAWTSPRGIPHAALRGYSSESFDSEVFDDLDADGRPVVVFYVGDLDPEGEDIDRNFRTQAHRAGVRFAHWERLAVTRPQIDELGLVRNFGKTGSSRAAAFIERHGTLFQIEVEAIDPAVLEGLVVDAVTRPEFFDVAAYNDVLRREEPKRERLFALSVEESQ